MTDERSKHTVSDPDLLTAAEAAELLRVSVRSVTRLIEVGKMPHSRIGPRLIRIRRDDVLRYIEQQRIVATGDDR